MNLFQETQTPNSSRAQAIILSGLLGLVVFVSFALGYFTRQLVSETSGNFALLLESHRILKEHAYTSLPEGRTLEYGAIRGMLQSLNDPFTTFSEPPAAELQTNRLEGKFGGIGVRIEKDKESNILLYPVPDSPAWKAGITDADRLVKVDQLVVRPDTSLDAIQAAIRGPVGSSVAITIQRASTQDEISLTIVRAEVASPSLTANIAPDDPQVGIIRLTVIAESSPDEISKAVKDLSSKGAKYFVLDLRDNGGGLVNAGVNLSGLFLEKGVTVIEEQFRGQAMKSYQTQSSGELREIPLILVVNQNTASAAEILAGALQFHHRAVLVGNRTFGKDAVQLVFPLRDGSNLSVTAGKWWLPGQEGRIGGKGLLPDVQLTDQEASSNAAIEKAIQVLKL